MHVWRFCHCTHTRTDHCGAIGLPIPARSAEEKMGSRRVRIADTQRESAITQWETYIQNDRNIEADSNTNVLTLFAMCFRALAGFVEFFSEYLEISEVKSEPPSVCYAQPTCQAPRPCTASAIPLGATQRVGWAQALVGC